MVFLAGRDRYTQRTLLRDVRDRLTKQAGCESVRYRPSRRRPREVVADVAPTTFLGDTYDAERARLEVRFWYPHGAGHEYYRINWIEPDRGCMFGFHRDGEHDDLGPCHVQLDYDDTVVERYPATHLDAHPLAVVDERLRQLPAALASIQWAEGRPTLPAWPP